MDVNRSEKSSFGWECYHRAARKESACNLVGLLEHGDTFPVRWPAVLPLLIKGFQLLLLYGGS